MDATGEDPAMDHEAAIMWLCRENYYNEMAKRAKEACNAYPTNEVLKLLLSIANALIGRIDDSINLIIEFTTENPVSTDTNLLAALFIQSIALRLAGSNERALISRIDSRIRDERRRATVISLTRAAMVLFLFQKYDKAREYVDRACKLEPADRNVSTIGAWVYLYDATTNPNVENSSFDRARELIAMLSNASSMTTNDLNVTLVSAKFAEFSGNHEDAIVLLSALVVRYPKLSLPLVEKMHNQLAAGDWEEAINSADRIISIEPNSIDALKARAIVALCRDGDFSLGHKHIQAFFRNLIIAEPTNYNLILDSIQLFARTSNRDAAIIGELLKIAERLADQSNVKLSRMMIELGNLYVIAGRIKDAERSYREAVLIDESSFVALTGLANCQIAEKPTNPQSINLARQQIDFLLELTNDTSNLDRAMIDFMSAKLYVTEPNKALKHLSRTVTIVLESLPLSGFAEVGRKNSTYRGYYQYLRDLNPIFCLDICEQYLVHCPCRFIEEAEAQQERADTSNDVERNLVCELLEKLVEACPGMGVALIMLAKVRIQAGYLDEALVELRKLLDNVEPANSAGHLLVAQIYAHRSNYELAEQSLELGLSFDFRVRDDPMYHLVSSIIEREKGNTESRINSLRRAIELVDSRANDRAISSLTAPISTSDKATLYIELVGAFGSMRKFDEATTLMEQARDLFGRSLEESRLVVANADLCLAMGDIERAINCLVEILPGNPYYLEAHTKLARIHLERRKDRQAFAKCFRELVEHCPGPRTYSMLGDAYMAIQEPDRAIEAYEESLIDNPQDRRLAERMGKALIKTHQYGKAIAYYREIVTNKACSDLKIDLAELYMRVKQFDKAEAVLVQELQDNRGTSDLTSLERRGIRLMLLAKIREKSGNLSAALMTLKEAKENQTRCMQRAPVGGTSNIEQKQALAMICLDMADHASSLRDYNQAIERYKEALSYKPADLKALLSLAKLYMQVNDLDRCGQSCSALLNADPDNEAASVMMADLAFRKVDFETAAFHFRQLLLRRPTYWTALARLIEVSRRTGNTSDLDEWLNRAALATDSSNREAGYHYCSGLLDWRTGKLNSALRNFNWARRDPEWGQQAIYNMIEICLDPDDDSSLSSEAFNDDDDSSEYHDSRTMALKTAQRLLLELSPKGNAHEMLTHRLLGDFFLLATKQKANIERALQDCTSLASQDSLRDHVGPALGLAMAHILMKQTPRARNHLKRVSKNVWTFEDAEYLERCWLLLADIYVQSSKYDLANELLKRVLQHNATCVRAHELSGHIAEREQNYREASLRYRQAWKYGGRTKLSVGYKLAYCSYKCKSYADAIQVCHQVLRQNPDFPRIKKDILEKSINNIRS